MRVRGAMRNIKELLNQLVGVRSLAVYFSDDDGKRLLPIARFLPTGLPRRGGDLRRQ